MMAIVLAALYALWEGFKWFGETTGLTIGSFEVNDKTFPHLHDIVGQLFEPSRRNGPLLIEVLGRSPLHGQGGGCRLRARRLDRVRARGAPRSLAPAPARLPPLHRRLPDDPDPRRRPDGRHLVRREGLPDWFSVSIIAAFLTFFPVAINTLRGLTSVDPRARAHALVRVEHAQILWKLRLPASLPYLFTAFKISATACVVGAIIGELPASIQNGLGGAILNFNQYYSTTPENLWATNLVAAALGIVFFLVVVVVEKIVVRRAPEHVA